MVLLLAFHSDLFCMLRVLQLEWWMFRFGLRSNRDGIVPLDTLEFSAEDGVVTYGTASTLLSGLVGKF
jgi:hypothetical protein